MLMESDEWDLQACKRATEGRPDLHLVTVRALLRKINMQHEDKYPLISQVIAFVAEGELSLRQLTGRIVRAHTSARSHLSHSRLTRLFVW